MYILFVFVMFIIVIFLSLNKYWNLKRIGLRLYIDKIKTF